MKPIRFFLNEVLVVISREKSINYKSPSPVLKKFVCGKEKSDDTSGREIQDCQCLPVYSLGLHKGKSQTGEGVKESCDFVNSVKIVKCSRSK